MPAARLGAAVHRLPFPASLAMVLPVIGAYLAFRAVQQRRGAKIVNRAMYATLFGAVHHRSALLQFFLPTVIAVGVAGFQVRKAESHGRRWPMRPRPRPGDRRRRHRGGRGRGRGRRRRRRRRRRRQGLTVGRFADRHRGHPAGRRPLRRHDRRRAGGSTHPNGGYLAAIVLRAIAGRGRRPRPRRPRSITLHYLRPGQVGPVRGGRHRRADRTRA